jgi:hypothetical protein
MLLIWIQAVLVLPILLRTSTRTTVNLLLLLPDSMEAFSLTVSHAPNLGRVLVLKMTLLVGAGAREGDGGRVPGGGQEDLLQGQLQGPGGEGEKPLRSCSVSG